MRRVDDVTDMLDLKKIENAQIRGVLARGIS